MLEKIIRIINEVTEVNIEDISEKTNLVVDLGLSSLDVFNLVVRFEDAFKIEIPDRDIRGFVSVGDVEGYVRGLNIL